jgi:DNA-binding transcriptional regulator WhiA
MKELIIQDYNSGMNTVQLSEKYNIHQTTAYRWVKESGIKMRTKSEAKQSYNLNHKAFNNITENSAYWVGFLIADGCISISKEGLYSKRLGVNLQIKDLNHMQKLCDFLETEKERIIKGRSTGFGNNSIQCRLLISSDEICNNLITYGMNGLFSEPIQELCDSRDFWRGVVDGDGCINIHKNVMLLNILGGRFLVEKFKEYVLTCGIRVKQNKNIRVIYENIKTKHLKYTDKQTTSLVQFQLHGYEARNFAYHLYNGCETFLDRKCKLALGF